MPAPTRAAIARILSERFPDTPTLTLAKRLYRENKALFTDQEAARTSLRYVRGNQGKAQRDKNPDKTSFRKPAQAGCALPLPPTKAEPWTPFTLDGAKRVLVLSDAHIPYHDSTALEAAVAWGRKWKPDTVLLNGDMADFFSISFWEKNPHDRDFPGEIALIRESLQWLRKKFPKARFVFKEGNHEFRYTRYIWLKAPELWGVDSCRLEHMLKLDELGIEYVDDQRPVMIGKLPVLHGHELGRGGIAPAVNPARGAFIRTHSSVLIGHHHRTSLHAEGDMWHHEIATWSTGCLCDLRPDFSKVCNKWNHGFAAVETSDDGNYLVLNNRISLTGEIH